MIGSSPPSGWSASRTAKRRVLAWGAAAVLIVAVASVLPVAVLAAVYAIYDAVDQAACHAARSC